MSGVTKKKELIRQVQRRTGMSYESVRDCLDSLVDAVVLSLMHGNDVNIRGFGRFYCSYEPGRQQPLFGSSQVCEVPPMYRLRFAVSRRLQQHFQEICQEVERANED